jgi:hypothetical protein
MSQYFDQYIAVLDQNREFRNLYVRVKVMHAGAAIISSPMPGTNQKVVLEHTLSKWPSAARANAIERMNLAVPVAERVVVLTHRYLSGRAGRERGNRQHFDEQS